MGKWGQGTVQSRNWASAPSCQAQDFTSAGTALVLRQITGLNHLRKEAYILGIPPGGVELWVVSASPASKGRDRCPEPLRASYLKQFRGALWGTYNIHVRVVLP